ncbi:nicotinate (nicotinamide) nucleotide adenylyltransferase [Gracilimonas mengyeensis]|uniref:Probable nicotinate-nucleotide adenylyltransferase n=1 Tax=Gracilimonas mengyeensis TaxID=1302730 RepID=A0A521AP66_9BACT|nr:nicotinate (nicotinamide) nucleotide adenylyltransferase [Gracilimonas mengyeensis]SMO36598.1 nicotinate-nucleotide adenylyltransferase [Gracilimonas mengyeensis]
MARSVGLFGGTFDPVHNGHLAIAKAFLDSPHIDELWVLLTPYPPHKQNDQQSHYKMRLNMLEAAFADFTKVKISTIENELPKPSYTVQTVRYLKKEHPETTFYFCMGEDSLAQFHTWKHHEQILEECDLLVAHRPGESHDDVDPDILSKVHFVDHQPLEAASSDIRKRKREGISISGYVPEKVLAIIKKNQLYST